MSKSTEEWKMLFGGMETPLEHFKRVLVSREAEASCALDGDTQFVDENGKLYGATPEQQEEYDRRNKEWKERRKEVIGKSIGVLSKHRLGNSRKEK